MLQHTHTTPNTFTAAQLAVLGGAGAGFWLLAALCVRFFAPLGWFDLLGHALMLIIALPVSWIAVFLIVQLVHLTREQIVPGISIGLGVATFCDGIALTWFPGLYGTGPAHILPGAAWILWGVFTFTLGAFIETYRR